jgi:hypothetical protein
MLHCLLFCLLSRHSWGGRGTGIGEQGKLCVCFLLFLLVPVFSSLVSVHSCLALSYPFHSCTGFPFPTLFLLVSFSIVLSCHATYHVKTCPDLTAPGLKCLVLPCVFVRFLLVPVLISLLSFHCCLVLSCLFHSCPGLPFPFLVSLIFSSLVMSSVMSWPDRTWSGMPRSSLPCPVLPWPVLLCLELS